MTPQEFLTEMARTASMHNFEEHMNLISRDVKVYGVPEHEVISYDDWFNQCKQEFEDKLLTSVGYDEIHILSEANDVICFIANEEIEASDGTQHAHCIKFYIKHEIDGQWRVTSERILSDEEKEEALKAVLQ